MSRCCSDNSDFEDDDKENSRPANDGTGNVGKSVKPPRAAAMRRLAPCAAAYAPPTKKTKAPPSSKLGPDPTNRCPTAAAEERGVPQLAQRRTLNAPEQPRAALHGSYQAKAFKVCTAMQLLAIWDHTQ